MRACTHPCHLPTYTSAHAHTQVLLSNASGPAAQKLLSPALLASGMGAEVYTPHLNRTEVKALESVFAFEQVRQSEG